MTSRGSAQCPVCRYMQKLRVDGMIGKHHVWNDGKYAGVCRGTGKRPRGV